MIVTIPTLRTLSIHPHIRSYFYDNFLNILSVSLLGPKGTGDDGDRDDDLADQYMRYDLSSITPLTLFILSLTIRSIIFNELSVFNV